MMKDFLRFSWTQSPSSPFKAVAAALLLDDAAALARTLSAAGRGKKNVKEGRVMSRLLFAVLHRPVSGIDADGFLYVKVPAEEFASLAVGTLAQLVPAVMVYPPITIGRQPTSDALIRIQLAQLQPDNYADGPRAYRTAALFCAVVVRLIDTASWLCPELASVRNTVTMWCEQTELAQQLWTCHDVAESDAPRAAQALEMLLRASSIRLATNSFCVLLLPVATHVHAMFDKESKPRRCRMLRLANEGLPKETPVSFYYDWECLRYTDCLTNRPNQHARPIERVAARLKESEGFEDRYALVLSKLGSAPAGQLAGEPSSHPMLQLADRLCTPARPLCSDMRALAIKKSWRIIGQLESDGAGVVGDSPQGGVVVHQSQLGDFGELFFFNDEDSGARAAAPSVADASKRGWERVCDDAMPDQSAARAATDKTIMQGQSPMELESEPNPMLVDMGLNEPGSTVFHQLLFRNMQCPEEHAES